MSRSSRSESDCGVWGPLDRVVSSTREDGTGSLTREGYTDSLTREGRTDSLSPEDRAQTEPIAALVAVLAVGVGLALYAGAASQATPQPERSSAAPAMERLSSVAVTDGTLDPSAIPAPSELAPGARGTAVTLQYDGEERRFGPAAPPDADRASRSVSVRVAPGDLRAGRVVVEVWP